MKKFVARVMVIFFMLTCIIAFQGAAYSEEPALSKKYAKDVRKLLILTGTDKISMQIMVNMFAKFKELLPQVPEEFWQEALKEFNADELIDLIIPVYAKHFSHDDIKEMIAFYESPLGKKITAALPSITQESMKLGELWGRDIAEKVKQRLVKHEYIKT